MTNDIDLFTACDRNGDDGKRHDDYGTLRPGDIEASDIEATTLRPGDIEARRH